MRAVSPLSSTHCFVSIIIALSDQIQDKREGGKGGGGGQVIGVNWTGYGLDYYDLYINVNSAIDRELRGGGGYVFSIIIIGLLRSVYYCKQLISGRSWQRIKPLGKLFSTIQQQKWTDFKDSIVNVWKKVFKCVKSFAVVI